MSWQLRTVIICLAAVAGCFQKPERVAPPASKDDDSSPILTIGTPEEFEADLKGRRLILHIDVDWAMQAVQSRPVIADFRSALLAEPEFQDIAFRRIDCTENGKLSRALKDWLLGQAADTSCMTGGYGAILWVQSGKVVDVVHYAAEVGVPRLIERTRKAFAKRR